ncbi:hypothetical protein XENOCAPTIV_014447, partial [Xenoophorus captivus]
MLAPRALRSWLCALSCWWLHTGTALRLKTPALPIQSEREPLPSKGLAGCSFGGRFYSLEDTWHPDLGEPFGVMHCVQCHCEPCDDSVLLPGHCCRTCPKDSNDKKQTDSMLDSFEYFHEKGKEDDLHKSYNDRSYLSSEDTGFVESRTVWKNLAKPVLRQLQSEQMRISMTTSTGRREEVEGKIIKHRALFAETFSSILTSEEENAGMGGIAMLTLSDSENNLHFILILQGLIRHKDKGSRFCRGADGPEQPRVVLVIAWSAGNGTIQSVMSSGDALIPGKTGGVGSAIFNLHDNGTLDYQVQVAGLTSDVVGLTIELKPRRRNKRSSLYDLTPEYSKATGQAVGSWSRLEARHIHMLLQNELFINVATAHSQEGELRGQIKALPYSGLEVPRDGEDQWNEEGWSCGRQIKKQLYIKRYSKSLRKCTIYIVLSNLPELPTPLAGHFVSPPVRTGASGHAWVSVDKQCHLHYEIIVAGLSKTDDVAVNAHLHGLAEIGELDDSNTNHKRLLTGFYGSQVRLFIHATAQGILKDMSVELLQHLDQGTAFIQVSTKMNPQGEIRGRV